MNYILDHRGSWMIMVIAFCFIMFLIMIYLLIKFRLVVRDRQLTLSQLDIIIQNTIVGIIHVCNRKFIWLNPKMEEMLGYKLAELRGQSTEIMYESYDSYMKIGNILYPGLEKGNYAESVHLLKRKDGSMFWCRKYGKAIDKKDLSKGVVWIVEDVSDKIKAEELIKYKAFHDPLTSLANRELLYDHFMKARAIAKRNNTLIAILFIDLDGFKKVNDFFGHKIGDLLLKKVGQILVKSVRELDTVSRIGGDEFVILLSQIDVLEDSLIVANKILRNLHSPLKISDKEILITPSIGISIYPIHGQEVEELLNKADSAMYMTKLRGKNNFHLYSEPNARDEHHVINILQ